MYSNNNFVRKIIHSPTLSKNKSFLLAYCYTTHNHYYKEDIHIQMLILFMKKMLIFDTTTIHMNNAFKTTPDAAY